MRKFFRQNRTAMTFLVAIILGVVMAIGQHRQREKNEAAVLKQGDIIVIPEIVIK